MNAQEARNHLALEALKRALKDGTVTGDELKARLLRAIREEEAKGPARMDTAFIAACESLLWEMNAPRTDRITSARREGYLRLRETLRRRRPSKRPGLLRAGYALVGAAMVFGLLYMALPRPQPEVLPAASATPGTPLPLRESLNPGDFAVTPTPSPTPSPTPTAAPTQAPPEPTQQPGIMEAAASVPKYLSLKDLKTVSPERFLYHSPGAGEGETIDAPILFPGGDSMPVPRLRWIPVNDKTLTSVLRAIAGADTGLQVSTAWTGTSFSINAMTADSPYFDIKYNAKNPAGDFFTDESEPENNPFTSDQAFELMKQLYAALGVDPGQVALYDRKVVSARYKVLDYQASPEKRYDTSRPVTGYEQGYHVFTGVQLLEGVTLLPHMYHESGPHYDLGASMYMKILNEKEFYAAGDLLRQTGRRVEDLPLANLDRMLDTLRQMIDSGRLLDVSRIQLCYELYYEEYIAPGDNEARKNAALLAVPVWQVLAPIYPSSAKQQEKQADSMIEYEDGIAELRFNAQTGEYMAPYDKAIKSYSPAILTWEQMEGEDEISLYTR